MPLTSCRPQGEDQVHMPPPVFGRCMQPYCCTRLHLLSCYEMLPGMFATSTLCVCIVE